MGKHLGNVFNALATQKTTKGAWTIGNLSGDEYLWFLYTHDEDYNAGRNYSYSIKMSAQYGIVAVKPTTLFDNASGITGTVSLSESVTGFSYLEIFYVLNGNIFKSVRVLSPDGKRIVLDGVWVATGMGLIQIETKTYTISGNSITPQTESWYANLVTTGVGSLGVQDTLKIFKVIGYK